MMYPHRLRVEYKKNPLGMDEKIPRFSYELTGGTGSQSKRRIQVTREDASVCWDSGWVESRQTIQIEYEGEALMPFTRYFWQVRIEDGAGEVSASGDEEAYFETGFLGTLWPAKWLGCSWGSGYNPQSRMLRDFQVEKPVKKARIYATALGVYDLWLNGEKIGAEDCLKPGWTDYFERVQYQAYDVTAQVRRGANTLAAVIADGWFCGKGYGRGPMLKAELVLTYEDGTVEHYPTCRDWRAFYIHIQNPMRMSNLYNGEVYEAWEETDWKMPGGYRVYAVEAREQDESKGILSRVRIVWQSGANIRRMHVMNARSIVKRPNGTYLVDFGQNFAGHEQFRLKNTMQGSTIVIKHGEMLNPDGSLYVENLRNAWQRTVYTTGTHDEEVYEPSYTYFGFRYLEISGWPGELTDGQIRAFAVYSDLEETGTFHCSEPLLNTLYSNIVWGQRSNFLDVPTDCPQRDERQGWTGDTQVFANIATYNMACGDFYTKWLEDLNLAQSVDGVYPNIAPKVSAESRFSGSVGWGDAGIVCPDVMMRKYGDLRTVRKYFRNMVAWIDWQLSKSADSLLANNNIFGDWLNIDAMMDPVFLSAACLAGTTARLERMAASIGENSQARRLNELGKQLREAVAKTFFSADGELNQKQQTAAVMALHYDLCPSEDARRKTLAWLKHDIVETRSMHLSTGFLGTPLLLRTLSDAGEIDLAYDLLLQTSRPGWLYPVTQGATTMWERWDSWTGDLGFSDPEMNSFNHYAYGAVGDWFFETICGIRPDPDEFAFQSFILSPEPGKRLTSAAARFHSPQGWIESAWTNTNGTCVWSFTVPCNTSAKVVPPAVWKTPDALPDGLTRSPDGSFRARPGHYELHFSVPSAQ